MAYHTKGSRFHPPRISGRQKLLRERAANQEKGLIRRPLEQVDLTQADWSTRKPKKR